MKQDIRDLFGKDEVSGKTLPDNHRQEFYDKLKASRPRRKSGFKRNYLLRIAAIAILFLAMTVVVLKTATTTVTNKVVEESSIETQIEVIEKEYLASIDKEWQNFISLATDEKLVKRYKDKLDNLDKDYQEISKQFKADNNNILVIEALVDNLKTRLQLLKDIQQHIHLLNQKTEQYETINI
ncbi:hypothetical protein [Psychroserpens luteolus]|uniref:hypothetical protein n=1 Tax=Psychroserpens luteolus TaxID=2855840 RepID=UPI001E46726F|nr:hypothetical protein [Psychroserpens luteolus]MCD2260000.1 hypothetical protein [Psychroserpens luteolus]